jgi:hypothetical protein
MTVEQFRKFRYIRREPQDRQTLGREIPVMLRVSTTSASKSGIPAKPSGSLSMRSAGKPSPPRRQDHVRWREMAGAVCRRRRNARPRERLVTNSVR